MNPDLARDSPPPLDFDRFMASLRDSECAAPIVSPRRFAAALHIDMQTLARLAHVHRNTLSRLAGSEGVQKYLREALRIIRRSPATYRARSSGIAMSLCRSSTTKLQNNSYPKDAQKTSCATSHHSRPGQPGKAGGMHCEPAKRQLLL